MMEFKICIIIICITCICRNINHALLPFIITDTEKCHIYFLYCHHLKNIATSKNITLIYYANFKSRCESFNFYDYIRYHDHLLTKEGIRKVTLLKY